MRRGALVAAAAITIASVQPRWLAARECALRRTGHRVGRRCHAQSTRISSSASCRVSRSGAPAAPHRTRRSPARRRHSVTYHGGPVQHSSTVLRDLLDAGRGSVPDRTTGRRSPSTSPMSRTTASPSSNPYGSDTQYYDVTSSREAVRVVRGHVQGRDRRHPRVSRRTAARTTCSTTAPMSKQCLTDAQIVNRDQGGHHRARVPEGDHQPSTSCSRRRASRAASPRNVALDAAAATTR